MSKSISIGGNEFESVRACIKECKRIIEGCHVGRMLSPQYDHFFRQLFTMHPDYEEKAGCGIKAIKYDWHSTYGTKCLIIIRFDGTQTAISWLSCLQRPTIKHQVQRAFREAVAGDISVLKASVVFSPQTCFLSGEKLGFNNSRAIYNTDLGFNDLVSEFLWWLNLEYEDVRVRYPNCDGDACPVLNDDILQAKWRAFHKEMAVITLISDTHHVSRNKSQDKVIRGLDYA